MCWWYWNLYKVYRMRDTLDTLDADSILIMYDNAWNTAFNEIDPHNDEKHPDHDGMEKVAQRSREIQAQAKAALLQLITREKIAVLNEHLRRVEKVGVETCAQAARDRIFKLEALLDKENQGGLVEDKA